VAMRVPVSESAAEMVILRGPWKTGIDRALVRSLEASRPCLVTFLERMLNAARAERERQQRYALANAAEVLTGVDEPKEALASIASAMSSVSGFDLVTIVLWDEATQKLGPRVINKGRWEETSLNQIWINPPDSRFDAPFIDTIRSGEPQPSPDVQNDSRVSGEWLEFCRGILAVSGAIVPVFFGDEPLAAISFASWKPHTFPQEEIEMLQGMAAQLAVGLKAMQMYKALAESRAQLEEYARRLEANRQIEHRLARTDALTGIPNRRYVEEVVDAEHARALRHGVPLSVGILDVDKLKAVNDEYGHDAGDEVLTQLARLARRSCRRGDVVGRYGGDEFLFVLPGADLGAALRFGERFRSKVEKQPFRLARGDALTLRVSLGIAEATIAAAERAPDLIASADAALYRAKSCGGNSVCYEGAASGA
jgi:diguanylate cyclase (GGDEF)-like protein